MNQLKLFSDSNKQQILIENINPEECIISRFNTRKTRSFDDIDKLIERIKRNGFELTRAPWAYKENGKYEIFAGGTRFEAAKKIGVNIPLILHEGYTFEEISLLSDQDNENDEYHTNVPIVDVWAEYARLRDEEGWTQEKIAGAKGVSQKTVSLRLKLHQLPNTIKSFIRQGILTERHFEEITKLYAGEYLHPWITPEVAWAELAEWAAKNKSTVRDTIKKINQWKEFIKYAEDIFESFETEITLYDLIGDSPESVLYSPQKEFIEGIVRRNARSLNAVKESEREIRIKISDNLTDYKTWVDSRTEEEAKKAVKLRHEKEFTDKVKFGPFNKILENFPNESVDLIFTDPPYKEKCIEIYGEIAQIAARILKPKASLIVYAPNYALPKLFEMMCPHINYWWQLIVKHSGPSSRLQGKKVLVEYKPLLWFVKGGRSEDSRYITDFIYSQSQGKELHEWQQSTIEAEYCIKYLTNEGGLVVDPCCGSGTTAIAALNLQRDFFICDSDENSVEATKKRIIEWMEKKPL